ncbi:alpha/beta-hydrolase [Mycena pura]|uniref:Alpha/beta-hydrolase n=1 Tax=Mycena pura TaxID=153505 RepID=A0AAD6V7V1_9AGAR|nr:alpha/beta-hydrolase [Mycena pura]
MSSSNAPQTAPYGTWESPLSAAMVAQLAVSVEDVLVDAVTQKIYYLEKRPEEGGRNVLVAASDGADVFGRQWDARTGVHSYGGASAAFYNDVAIFSNASDAQVYTVDLRAASKSPKAITAAKACRFSSFAFHPGMRELVVCVMEDHTKPAPQDIVNTLVCLDSRTLTEKPTPFIFGTDFYTSPTFNADGTLLAWTQWANPDMPWDGEQIYVAAVRLGHHAGGLSLAPDYLPPTRVAGRPSAISAVQPTWISHHTLMFCSDESSFQNPFVATISVEDKTVNAQAVLTESVPEDFADPPWSLGVSNFAPLDETAALFVAYKAGRSLLYVVNIDGDCTEVPSPYVQIERMRRVGPGKVVFLGSPADRPREIVLGTFIPSGEALSPSFQIINQHTKSAPPLPAEFISLPHPVELFSSELNRSFHIVYYPPKNPNYKGGKPNENPPAVISVHGGPTFLEKQSFSLEKQFFTTRGWVWIDVNYSGSSNFGREYINRLYGTWGVADVDDCIQTVLLLSSPTYNTVIDRKRAVIRGRSSGGYATFVALTQPQREGEPPVFAAGTSCYGISDIGKLAEQAHKFQRWSVPALMGGTPEQIPDVYRDRSPVYHAENISSPLLILQGAADPLIPPSQAEDMVRVIRKNGGTCDYILYEGEGHGWRRADTIENALRSEMEFYQRALLLL